MDTYCNNRKACEWATSLASAVQPLAMSQKDTNPAQETASALIDMDPSMEKACIAGKANPSQQEEKYTMSSLPQPQM